MSLIEGKIVDAVLNRIRARTASLNGGSDGREVPSHGNAKSVSVREVQFSDFEQVRALTSRLGQGPDSAANWRRLWLENPALNDGKGCSIGWMLETSQGAVGFLGSIPLQYEFEGSVLRAAATCRLAVEPAYRAFSHLLIVSFFRQKNVDLFLNTTATVAAGKMMTALKASPLPQPNYGTVLFWVLNERKFTKEVFKKLGVKSSLAGSAAAVVSLGLKADAAIRKRSPRRDRHGYSTREISLDAIGQKIQGLWETSSNEPKHLFAKRTPEIMSWHFDPPGDRRTVKVFGSFKENELMGYIIVRHDPDSADGIRRSLVADLLVKNDNPHIMEYLFAAALSSAKDAGCDVLEVIGFPECVRRTLLQWKPYTRQYPAGPFFFKARDPKLHEKLNDKDVWYASPFDGDATLWP